MADSDPIITEDEYVRWLDPDAALTLVNNKTGSYVRSYAAILKRAGAGYIRAAAKNIDRHDADGKVVGTRPFALVAPATLKNCGIR